MEGTDAHDGHDGNDGHDEHDEHDEEDAPPATSGTMRAVSSGSCAEVPFVVVGRTMDQSVLAEYFHPDFDAIEKERVMVILGRLLQAAKHKMQPGSKQRLQWDNGSIICKLDSSGQCLYALMTSSLEYPERVAYALLDELILLVTQSYASEEEVTGSSAKLAECSVGGLTEELGPAIKRLVDQYGAARQDALRRKRAKSQGSVTMSSEDTRPRRSTRFAVDVEHFEYEVERPGAAGGQADNRSSSMCKLGVAIGLFGIVALLVLMILEPGGPQEDAPVGPPEDATGFSVTASLPWSAPTEPDTAQAHTHWADSSVMV